jgi:hypothetical protein
MFSTLVESNISYLVISANHQILQIASTAIAVYESYRNSPWNGDHSKHYGVYLYYREL